MSHIFDALQRSEAERSGADRSSISIATELLELAERDAVAKWDVEASGEPRKRPASLDHEPASSMDRSSPSESIAELPASPGSPRWARGPKFFVNARCCSCRSPRKIISYL